MCFSLRKQRCRLGKMSERLCLRLLGFLSRLFDTLVLGTFALFFERFDRLLLPPNHPGSHIQLPSQLLQNHPPPLLDLRLKFHLVNPVVLDYTHVGGDGQGRVPELLGDLTLFWRGQGVCSRYEGGGQARVGPRGGFQGPFDKVGFEFGGGARASVSGCWGGWACVALVRILKLV